MKNRKGFTLIELMIVVAIIAILAAIAVPQYKAYVMRSRNSSAAAQVGVVRSAEGALMHDIDCFGITPASANTLAEAPGGSGDGTVLCGPAAEASADKSGAMITGTNPDTNATGAVPIGIANGIYVQASTDDRNASYIAVAIHFDGDTAYGSDSDCQNVYWVKNPEWPGSSTPPGTDDEGNPTPADFPNGLNVPTPVPNQNDFAGFDGGGSPTTNWTPK